MGNMNKFLSKFTINQYGKIRFAKEFLFQKAIDSNMINKNKHIWFLDAPAYGNVGDQAIAYAIKKFCRDVLPSFEIIEFQEGSVIQYLHSLKKRIKPEDIIVLQGGGNLGNLYPRYEFVRRTIVKTFNENRIIVFPQSFYFSTDKNGDNEIKASRKAYATNRKLILFARDSRSYQEMKKAFPDTQIELCPDIVFSLNGLVLSDNRKGLGICMREDKEKSISAEQIEQIIDQISKKCIEKNFFDTVLEVKTPVVGAYREKLVINKLKEFAECEIVVTDRLHGMIFSYITSTPCIAIGNSTGKSLYSYEDWLSKSSNVSFVQEHFKNIVIPKKVKSQGLDFERLKNILLSEMGEQLI